MSGDVHEPELAPTLTTVVVSFNSASLIGDCISALTRSKDSHSNSIVIVDNASSDDTVQVIRRLYPAVTVIVNARNAGFGEACNIGAHAEGSSEFIFFLNPDCIVRDDTIAVLLNVHRTQSLVGAVGPVLRDNLGRVELSPGPSPDLLTVVGQLFGAGRWLGNAKVTKALSGIPRMMRSSTLEASLRRRRGTISAGGPLASGFLSGACMLVRRDAFDDVDGFDRDFGLYYEDADFCERLRKRGWRIWFEPSVEVLHMGGASSAGRFRRYHPVAYSALVRYLRRHRGWAYASAARVLVACIATLRLLRALCQGFSAANRREVRDLFGLTIWSWGLKRAQLK